MDLHNMFNKHIIFSLALMSSGLSFAIPIENYGLSQSTSSPLSTPPATNTGTDTSPTNLNWQLLQKNESLENELRSLRGKIEELENSNEKLNHDLTNRYTDLDQRLELLLQKIDPEQNTDTDDSTTEDNQQGTAPSSNITPPVAQDTPNVPPQSLNNDELDRAAYTIALEAYKQGGAAKAIAPMRNFIKNHPNSVYIGNAYFWMGEFYLAIEPINYQRAKANYASVVKNHPQSSKASTALFRLYSLAKTVDRDQNLAMQYQNQLKKNYPNAEEIGFLK